MHTSCAYKEICQAVSSQLTEMYWIAAGFTVKKKKSLRKVLGLYKSVAVFWAHSINSALTPTYNTCMKMPVSHQRCDCIGYLFAFHSAWLKQNSISP